MIACLSRITRWSTFFDEIASLDPRYRNLGTTIPDRSVLIQAFLASLQLDLAAAKRDARFAPLYLKAMETNCIERLDRVQDPIEAVLCWGAQNVPLDESRHRFPYFIITDGPFDPENVDYPPEWRPGRWAGKYFETQRRVYRGARHVFAQSEWARQRIMAIHGLNESSVSRCGWGPEGNYGPPRFEPAGGKTIFVSVGSEWRRKGMDIVAEAGARAHAKNPDIETIIVGDPVGESLAPRPGVSLLPVQTPRAIVHCLMRQASCLIIASRFDASPHVIFEALQYGTPVLGFRSCGIPEAIDEPNGGFVFGEPTADSLLAAMDRFMSANEQSLRSSAYETYVQSGGWQAVATRVHGRVASELSQIK